MKDRILKAVLASGGCFALTFLLSAAVFPLGLSPFYLAGYTSLLALGGNYFALTASYLLARFLSGGLLTLMQAAFAAAGVGVTRALSLVLRRRIHPFYSIISAFFAELFTMFFLPTNRLFLFLGDAAIAALFAMLCLRVVLRGRRRVLLLGQWGMLPFATIAFALGASAYGLYGFGITPYYLFLAFLTPLFAVVGVGGGAIPLAFALGGTAVSGRATLCIGALAAWLIGVCAKKVRRVAAFCVLIAYAILLVFGIRAGSLLNYLLMASGGFLAAFCPETLYRRLGARFGKSERGAAHAVVNKVRADLSGKLGYVEEAMRKMSESLFRLDEGREERSLSDRLSGELARKLCAGCGGYRDCAAQGGGSSAALFSGAMLCALQKGKATICDLPPYLNGNCHKIKPLLEGLNEAGASYRRERERAAFLTAERERMAAEAEGIAGILDVLRRDTKRVMTFDGKREKKMLAELQREGIVAYDAMVTEEDGMPEATVTLDEGRAEDPRVISALSRALDTPLIPVSVSDLGAGAVSASFVSAPLYDAIIGQAVGVKEGSEACGDTKGVTRLNGDRIMIALSDGMGSGEEANLGSGAAIALVENFYRTGVDERVVLPLINRLLTIRNDDTFQTLDICVVNLRTGEADFIKLSAPESVIRRRDGSEIVEGGALPLGILSEVRPEISRKRLSSGDVVVLMTDGVTDAIGTDGVLRVLESGRTNNPQTIAENIVRDASYVSAADDRTVVALRLFRRI